MGANQLSCEYTWIACISVYAWEGWTKGYCNLKFPSPVCTHSFERWLIKSQHHSRSQNVVDEGFRRWQPKATWAKTAVTQTEILRSVVKQIQSVFPCQSKKEIRAIKFWIQTNIHKNLNQIMLLAEEILIFTTGNSQAFMQFGFFVSPPSPALQIFRDS